MAKEYKDLVVGLDIGSSAVRAVEVATRGRSAKVRKTGRVPLPPGAVEGFKEIIGDIQRSGHYSFLNVFKLFGPGNQAPLSFTMEGWNVCVDFPINDRLNSFVNHLDAKVMSMGGRLYTAKDSRVPAGRFHAMYPELPGWLKTRRDIDPTGVFLSDMGRRLELN